MRFSKWSKYVIPDPEIQGQGRSRVPVILYVSMRLPCTVMRDCERIITGHGPVIALQKIDEGTVLRGSGICRKSPLPLTGSALRAGGLAPDQSTTKFHIMVSVRIRHCHLILENVVHVDDWQRCSIAQAAVTADRNRWQAAGVGIDIHIRESECGCSICSMILLDGCEVDIGIAGLSFQQQRRRKDVHIIHCTVLRIIVCGSEVSGDIAPWLNCHVGDAHSRKQSSHCRYRAVVCISRVEQVAGIEPMVNAPIHRIAVLRIEGGRRIVVRNCTRCRLRIQIEVLKPNWIDIRSRCRATLVREVAGICTLEGGWNCQR